MHDLRKPPRRFSDETIVAFRLARFVGARVWPGKRAYRRSVRRTLERVDVDVPVVGLSADLDGFAIVQISDLHAGDFVDEATLDPVVDLVRACRPDVLAITGDFVMRWTADAAELGTAIARMPAACGKFAVFGNHDYRGRQEATITAQLRRGGCRVLRNESVRLRRGDGLVAIAGLEDIEESKGADVDAATAGWDGAEHVRVLLCHNPDVVDALPPDRFDLVLSGHSHGGQIVAPPFSWIARRWMPKRLRGTHELGDAPRAGRLHVNRGIGALVLPFRFRSRPEVTRLVLRAAEVRS